MSFQCMSTGPVPSLGFGGMFFLWSGKFQAKKRSCQVNSSRSLEGPMQIDGGNVISMTIESWIRNLGNLKETQLV